MNLVKEEDLKEWTGYDQRASIEKWLEENEINYRLGKKGRICVTSEDLKNKSNSDFDEIEF